VISAFAHASEAELARILDFYGVRWEYEPHTFPVGWSLEGAVVESFSPDFYLPDMELYVELTTLKQKLVRKKNRKLRRLRELYPEVRIKLFYARDFRMLLLKFGRLALVDELSGTTGQSTPPRGRATNAAAPADEDTDGTTAMSGVGGTDGSGEHPEGDAARPRGRRRGRRRRRSAAAPHESPVSAPAPGARVSA
jgi:hypoxanthine phosphoribosyltransferase